MAKKQIKKNTLLRTLFRVILIIAAISLALSYVATFINPAKLWMPSIFGIYFIPLLILNILLLVIALIFRPSSALIPFIAIIPASLFMEYFFRFENTNPIEGKDQIKVITYNVGRFGSNKKEIANFLNKENADIVALQEFYIKDTTQLDKFLKNYPHNHYHFFKLRNGYFFGNITFSKHPLVGGGKLTFKKSTNLSLFSDFKIGKETFRVYNNHLESFNIPLKSLIDKINHREFDKASDDLVNAYDKVILTNKKRAEQVIAIVNHIKDIDNAIICGDLNDTPMSYTFHQLRQNKLDTFAKVGKGFGATYSMLWPLLRIDFILIPNNFIVTKHTTPKLEWSDHYPVIAKFNIQ